MQFEKRTYRYAVCVRKNVERRLRKFSLSRAKISKPYLSAFVSHVIISSNFIIIRAYIYSEIKDANV